jgi:cysteine desulfuration protein SufE
MMQTGTIDRVLQRFQAMSRDEKMQALVQYSKKLEPIPVRYEAIDRSNYTIPECQTRVDIFPEAHDGVMHFYADVNVRPSPTISAHHANIISAV